MLILLKRLISELELLGPHFDGSVKNNVYASRNYTNDWSTNGVLSGIKRRVITANAEKVGDWY